MSIYRKIKDISASQLYELQERIEALYEMLPLDKDNCDEVWLRSCFRHILECILTDEAFFRLYDEDNSSLWKKKGGKKCV